MPEIAEPKASRNSREELRLLEIPVDRRDRVRLEPFSQEDVLARARLPLTCGKGLAVCGGNRDHRLDAGLSPGDANPVRRYLRSGTRSFSRGRLGKLGAPGRSVLGSSPTSGARFSKHLKRVPGLPSFPLGVKLGSRAQFPAFLGDRECSRWRATPALHPARAYLLVTKPCSAPPESKKTPTMLP